MYFVHTLLIVNFGELAEHKLKHVHINRGLGMLLRWIHK